MVYSMRVEGREKLKVGRGRVGGKGMRRSGNRKRERGREGEGGREEEERWEEAGVMEAAVDIVWHYRQTFSGGTLPYWFCSKLGCAFERFTELWLSWKDLKKSPAFFDALMFFLSFKSISTNRDEEKDCYPSFSRLGIIYYYSPFFFLMYVWRLFFI